MAVRIATAPDSWGVWFPDDPQQVSWRRFLDEAALAGYTAIELGPFGYLPTDAVRLRTELAGRGLTLTGATMAADYSAAAASDPGASWREMVPRVCEVLAALDAGYLVLLDAMYTDSRSGRVIHPKSLGAERWQRLAETLHAVGEAAASFGVTTAYHPHADTPIEYEWQIERLLDATDPAVVSLCLDVGHHAYRGGDPVAFMRRHHGRIPYLHLKNVDPRLLPQPDGPGFAEAVRAGVFTELDRGVVDHEALRDVLTEVGYDGWAVVEQDMYPCPPSRPLPVAMRNLAFLRSISMEEPT